MATVNKKHAHLTNEDLQKLVKEGFQTSSYHGVDGKIEQQRQEDEVQAKDTMRFAAMISNDLDPYPAPKVGVVPKGLGTGNYNHSNNTINHKTHTFRNGEEMAKSMPKFDGEKSTTGRVPNGLNKSLGFLETMSTQQEDRHRAKFDGDVMSAYQQGKQREAAAEAERSRLQNTPFRTAEPSMYVKSTQEHCNVLGVGIKDKALSAHNSEARQLPGARGGSQQPSPTRHNEIKAQEAQLLETLHSMRNASKPRDNRVKKTSALGWSSTAHDAFDDYDCAAAERMNDRYATQPVSHRNQQLTDEDMQRVEEVDRRFATRYENGFETEVSNKLQDRHLEADVPKGNGVTGTFSLKGGVPLMSGKVHHPRDVRTGENFSTSSVVPGQFKAMSANSMIQRDD